MFAVPLSVSLKEPVWLFLLKTFWTILTNRGRHNSEMKQNVRKKGPEEIISVMSSDTYGNQSSSIPNTNTSTLLRVIAPYCYMDALTVAHCSFVAQCGSDCIVFMLFHETVFLTLIRLGLTLGWKWFLKKVAISAGVSKALVLMFITPPHHHRHPHSELL